MTEHEILKERFMSELHRILPQLITPPNVDRAMGKEGVARAKSLFDLSDNLVELGRRARHLGDSILDPFFTSEEHHEDSPTGR